MRNLTPILFVWILTGSIAAADGPPTKPIEAKPPDRPEPVSYALEVADILAERCVGCHGSALAENRLSLEDVPSMLKGGKRGAALVPGKSAESLLFQMAAHQLEPVMPPADRPGNPPLSPEELGLLKRWIDEGAIDDSESIAESGHRRPTEVVLGPLPPTIQPIYAVDLSTAGLVAAGRANRVPVYDLDSGLLLTELGGHQDLIQSVRFSPDGRLLAAASFQIVTLWRVPGVEERKSYQGHGGPVLSLCLSEDRTTLFSGGQDSTIRCWNLANGKLQWTLTRHAPVTALALKDRTLAAGFADGSIHLISVDECREWAVLTGHQASVEDLTWLPGDGERLRVASVSADGTGRIWKLPCAVLSSPSGPAAPSSPNEAVVLQGHTGPVRAVVVVGDGQTIITAGEDATLRFWNAADGQLQESRSSGHSGPILALAASPDGSLVATGSADRTARLFSLADGPPSRVFEGHSEAVLSVAFSPSGHRLATATSSGELDLWPLRPQAEESARVCLAANSAWKPLAKIRFADDDRVVAAGGDGAVRDFAISTRWSLERTLGPHLDRVLALDFSPSGALLAAGGGEPSRSGEIKVWETASGSLAVALDALHSDTVFGLRFSPDGGLLASASADKFLKVSSIPDGKPVRSFEGHTHHVLAVDWRADGKQLVTGGADRVLKLWDLDSGEQVRTFQETSKQISAVRWMAGKPEIVSAEGNARVQVWNADNGQVVRGLGGLSDYAFAVAASADGARIAAGGADGVLVVWDGRDGQVLRKFDPPAPADPPPHP